MFKWFKSSCYGTAFLPAVCQRTAFSDIKTPIPDAAIGRLNRETKLTIPVGLVILKAMANVFHLLVAIPNQAPAAHSLNGEKVTLGRSPDNDIQILIREISTSHCEFRQTPSGYEITDLGTTNGTKLNEQPVKESALPLKNRDILLLGETVSAYFIETSESEAIDVQGLIGEIKEEAEKAKPAVKKLAPPAAVKKVGVPTVKPPVSKPIQPTPAAGEESGSATVKLVTPPKKKLASPSLAKKAAPGGPVAPPAAPVTPTAPGAGEGGTVKKLAVPKPATPSEGNAPKIDLPKKKVPPKLNLPQDEE